MKRGFNFQEGVSPLERHKMKQKYDVEGILAAAATRKNLGKSIVLNTASILKTFVRNDSIYDINSYQDFDSDKYDYIREKVEEDEKIQNAIDELNKELNDDNIDKIRVKNLFNFIKSEINRIARSWHVKK